LFGYMRSETINRPISELNLLKISKEDFTRDLEKVRNNESVIGEYTLMARDGREFPGLASNSAIIGQEGQIEALLTIIRDISEEKDHLLKLEQSETRFRKLFENSAMGSGLIDLKSKKWLDANHTLLKLLGYSLTEIRNLTYTDITPNDFLEDDMKRGKQVLKNQTFGPYRKEYIKKNGSHVKVIVNGFIMSDGDKSRLAWT